MLGYLYVSARLFAFEMAMEGQVEPVELNAANAYAARSTGHFGAPLRREFLIRPEGGEPTALNRIMSSRTHAGGGRGGKQRLALLVTALWVCSRPPHSTQRSASWWADLIGAPEPRSQTATRSVIANLRELERRKFIDFKPGRAGYAPTVTLRSELGNGAPYNRPHLDEHPSYIRIPETLWTRNRIIGQLDARALAMYLVTVYYDAIRPGDEMWFSDGQFRKRHGMAEATRLNGLNHLVNHGILTMREGFPDVQHGVGYRATRRRYYRLDPLFAPPRSAKPEAVDTGSLDEVWASTFPSTPEQPIDSPFF